MVLVDEFYEQLSKCPIKKINTIKDIENIRDFYFTIFDKYELDYINVNIIFNLDKDSALLIHCNRQNVLYLQFITKLDNMIELDLEYNKYCYYNISDIDEFKLNYNNYKNNNDSLFLDYWTEGNNLDLRYFDKHIKNRKIELIGGICI